MEADVQRGGATVPYILFFLGTLWHTLGAVVICGLAVAGMRYLFLRMMGHGFGRGVVMATSIVGTPVHELGHAAMCLLFGHKIKSMSLWQPRSPDGNLGYVTHTYHRRNPWHILGNLFIGIGPIFSGLCIIALALLVGFPATLSEYAAAASDLLSSGEGGLSILAEGFRMLPHMIEELLHDPAVPVWARVLALLLIVAVAQHVSLSPADIKGALTAIPLYLALLLVLTVICGLLGQTAMDTVLGGLALFSGCLWGLFTVVLVASLFQLLLALPVWVVRVLLGKA